METRVSGVKLFSLILVCKNKRRKYLELLGSLVFAPVTLDSSKRFLVPAIRLWVCSSIFVGIDCIHGVKMLTPWADFQTVPYFSGLPLVVAFKFEMVS